MLPPGLSHGLGPQVVALLQLLEVATGVGFCCHCCNLQPHCRCVGVPPLTSPMSWSQFMEQTLAYGVTSPSGGVTAPSTSQGGMSGYVSPLPGISIWNMPPLEDAIPPRPVTILLYWSPTRGAGLLRSMMSMRGIVPQTPQIPTPIRQLPLLPQSRQATPYQQLVQLPSKTSGLGVTFDSSTSKPAPTDSRDTDACRRQATRGQDDARRPASCPRGGRERSSVRKTNVPMPCQEGGCPAGAPCNPAPFSTSSSKGASTDPLESITNYRSQGWRKDLSHILRAFYLYNYPSCMEADWEKLRTKFLNHLGQHQDEWKTIKGEMPLEYMPYMECQFLVLTDVRLKGLSQFTRWIKPGSYYHGVVANSTCACTWLEFHLRQVHKSTLVRLMQKKVETPTASPHMPGKKGVATQGARSDVPTPMETGGAGDGHSWVDQVDACPKEEWRRDRLAKCPRALSRRWDPHSINPFPLQDSEGRHEAVQQLYCHAGELTPAHHDVAAQGMATHHPDLEACMTKSLNNMVLCMISEYHLTCLSQGPSYVSLVLPEAAKNLLPSLEEYRAGGDFQGTRDARVLERAKTLWVAVWLHRLDMAAAGDREASYSLDASKHGRGPLLEFLLTPHVSNLTFEEVVHRVLGENQDKMMGSLNHVQGLQAWLQGELEDLQRAHKDEPNPSARRRMKKEMEQKWKDLKGLKATISEYKSCLRGGGHEDDPSDSEAEGAMAITPVAEFLTFPPGEEHTHTMEVDDGDEHPTPASPVSPREDDLVTGDTVVGVEGRWPTSRSHLPGKVKAVTRVPPSKRPFALVLPTPAHA